MSARSRVTIRNWNYRAQLIPTLVIVVILGSALLFWTQPALEKMLLQHKRAHMRDLVQLGWTLANDLNRQVETGMISSEVAQRRFLDHIASFRYGEDSKDYLWVHDLDCNLLVHPYSKPVNLSEHRDKNGLAVVPEMNRIAKTHSEGFLDYYWQWKDIDQREEAKVSYVKLFEPWGWVIGSGFYRTDAIRLIQEISRSFLGYATVLVVGVLLLSLLTVRLNFLTGLLLRSKDQMVQKSRNRFEQMAKHLSSGIAILEDGELVFYNRQLGEFLKLADLEGDALPDSDAQRTVSEFLECSKTGELVQQNPDGEVVRGCWIPDADGQARYVVVRATLDPDAKTSYVVVSDWTQRKRHLEELDLLSKIIRDCPLSVVITDTMGIIQYANPCAASISGFSQEELLGANPRVLKSSNVPASVYEKMWQTITSGKTWQGELLNRSKTGVDFWEYVIIAPMIDEQGEIQCYYAIKQDITPRKNLERELVDARRKAEESERVKSAFLNNVSHEIRTPLNAICGFVHLLEDELKDHPHLAEFQETIHENTQTLVGLVDDILKISELESSKYFNNYENWNLDELLTDCLSEARLNTGTTIASGITFKLDFDPLLQEKVVYTDREKFDRIFGELISNAIKFTREGEITVGYRYLDGQLLFRVSDTGVGIPDEEKPHIFKLFYHGEKNFVSLHKGTGLGLNIVKMLIHQMGGTIRLESTSGIGTTFIVEGICTLHHKNGPTSAHPEFYPML